MPKDIKTLNPMQKRLYLSQSPNIAVLGGFGGGKSWGTLYKVRELMRLQPNSLWMIGRSTLKDLKADTYEICFGSEGIFNGLGKQDKHDHFFQMYNGSKIYFAHFDDPDTLKGPSLSGILIEQGEMIKEEVFNTLTSRLRQWGNLTTKGTQGYKYIQKYGKSPNYIQSPKHYFYLIANPGGHGWLKQRFLDKNNPLWEVIHSTTYDNEVNLPKNYIPDLIAQHNELWVQKYIYGSFEKAEGIIYPEFTDEHIIEPLTIKLNEKILVSIDPGYQHASVAIFGVIRDEKLIIFDEVYEKNQTISEVADIIKKQIYNQYGPRYKEVDITYLIDPSANRAEMGTGLSIKAQYVNAGIIPIDADNEKKAAIHVIKDLLKAKKILVTENCTNTIREFGIYKWHPTKPDEVVKTDDDCISGDSWIDTPSGQHKIKDIVGKELDVYSYDNEENRLVVKRAYNIHSTGFKNTIKITLDSGVPLITTEDHLFLVKRNKNYVWKMAKDLNPYDSLMALNRRVMQSGHLKIAATGHKYKSEHRFVYEYFRGTNIKEHIHHIDHKKYNNVLENLIDLNASEHNTLHKKGIRLTEEQRLSYSKRFRDWANEHPEQVKENARKASLLGAAARKGKNHKVINIEFYGNIETFNMEVPDTHAFFANGVLVHNCMDAIRYIVNFQPEWKTNAIVGENINEMEDRKEATRKYIQMIFKEETEEKEEDPMKWGLN